MSGAKNGNGRDPGVRRRAIGAEPAKALAKRFYGEATAARRGSAFAVLLDGRPVKTPGKAPLQLPTLAFAKAVAREWASQIDTIDPLTMPLTRLSNTAIDGVRGREDLVRADIVKYAGTDLLCYRAVGPAGLVAAQARHWDPVLAWVATRLGAAFSVTAGIIAVGQDAALLAALDRALAPLDPFELAAAHVMTTLLGSAVLALALLEGGITPESAWAAAHVDEDWQFAQWGEDHEAAERRRHRRADFDAAVQQVALVRSAAT